MAKDRARLRAELIEVDEANEQLFVRWRDGRESRSPLAELRRACPCAGCRERQSRAPTTAGGELLILDSRAAAASARAVSIDPVGHYGLRITWGDGHNHGIYSFEALRSRDGG